MSAECEIKLDPAPEWLTETVWVEIQIIPAHTGFQGYDRHHKANILHDKECCRAHCCPLLGVLHPHFGVVQMQDRLTIAR